MMLRQFLGLLTLLLFVAISGQPAAARTLAEMILSGKISPEGQMVAP